MWFGTLVPFNSDSDWIRGRPGVRAQAPAYETLYNFQGTPDGANPHGGVVIGGGGKLYGTTSSGGTSAGGTIFALVPGATISWEETVLHNFTGPDGASPYASMHPPLYS